MVLLDIAADLARVATGNPARWKHVRYQVRMAWRRIDLSWMSVRDLGLSEERSHWHSSSGGPDLEAVLHSMSISPRDSVIDLGCGKGGAMLTLAQYPFRRVNGVEISPELARIAERNLQRSRIRNATVLRMDAAEFRDFDAYTYVYMYNPFPGVVMRSVIQNLVDSAAWRDGRLTVIYRNPVCHDLLLQSGLRQIGEFHPGEHAFCTYTR